MTDAITASRTDLFDAIKGCVPAGRAHKFVPKQIATPCLWLERPRLLTRTEGRATTVIVTTWGIMLAADGEDVGQQSALDGLLAEVWDAAEAATNAHPIAAYAQPIDIGGPTVTAMRIDVDMTISARSLCGPNLKEAASG